MSDTKVKTKAELGWPLASLLSFVNWNTDFFPRLSDGNRAATKRTDAIIAEMAAAMGSWSTVDQKDVDGHLKDVLELAKASLVEVKAQTEYQDQKATRLLTVTTFLSALFGALFASFSGRYPLTLAWPFANLSRESGIVAIAYLAFALFVLAALFGALVTFHATRTRFKVAGTTTVGRQDGPVRSHLFFQQISDVTPRAWAGSFVTVDSEGGSPAQLNQQLRMSYLRNYVTEAYLVAAKTADKLRYLEPAQSLLAWALRMLVLFVVFAAIAVMFVPLPPVPKP